MIIHWRIDYVSQSERELNCYSISQLTEAKYRKIMDLAHCCAIFVGPLDRCITLLLCKKLNQVTIWNISWDHSMDLNIEPIMPERPWCVLDILSRQGRAINCLLVYPQCVLHNHTERQAGRQGRQDKAQAHCIANVLVPSMHRYTFAHSSLQGLRLECWGRNPGVSARPTSSMPSPKCHCVHPVPFKKDLTLLSTGCLLLIWGKQGGYIAFIPDWGGIRKEA